MNYTDRIGGIPAREDTYRAASRDGCAHTQLGTCEGCKRTASWLMVHVQGTLRAVLDAERS